MRARALSHRLLKEATNRVWSALLATTWFTSSVGAATEPVSIATLIQLDRDQISVAKQAPPTVVAIVDDGVIRTDPRIAPYLWRNPAEIARDGIDNDGNGLVDDVAGWDAADGDPDPSPPAARQAELYHGTHVAG